MQLSANALKIARQYAGVSQRDLSSYTKINQATLSMIERGLEVPTIEEEKIEAIGQYLGVTSKFLKERMRVQEPKRPMQRSAKSGVRVSEEQKSLALANLVQQGVNYILSTYFDLEINLPDLSADIVSTAKEAAISLRRYWGLGFDPIENLTEVCESFGLIIYRNRFPTKSIVGFTMDSNDIGHAIVFLNEGLSTDRDRLTLAHEIGHQVRRHDLAIDNENFIEKEAWEFAAEFLVPEIELRRDLKTLSGIVSLHNLILLKKKWGVSIQSLVMRLANLGIINQTRKQSLFVQMSRAGYRKKEPVELPSENENILNMVFDMMRTEYKLSMEEIVKELEITEKTFYDLFGKYWGSQKSVLRLIK